MRARRTGRITSRLLAYLLVVLLVVSSGPLPAAYSKDQHKQRGGHSAAHSQHQQRNQSHTRSDKGHAKSAKPGKGKKSKGKNQHKHNTSNSKKGPGKRKDQGQNTASMPKADTQTTTPSAQACQTRGNSNRSKGHKSYTSTRNGHRNHQTQSAARQRQDNAQAKRRRQQTPCGKGNDMGPGLQRRTQARDVAAASVESVALAAKPVVELVTEPVLGTVAADAQPTSDAEIASEDDPGDGNPSGPQADPEPASPREPTVTTTTSPSPNEDGSREQDLPQEERRTSDAPEDVDLSPPTPRTTPEPIEATQPPVPTLAVVDPPGTIELITVRAMATTEPAPGDHHVPEPGLRVEATTPAPDLPETSTPATRPVATVAATSTPVEDVVDVSAPRVLTPASTIAAVTPASTPVSATHEAVPAASQPIVIVTPLTSPTVVPPAENTPVASDEALAATAATLPEPVSALDLATPTATLLPLDNRVPPAAATMGTPAAIETVPTATLPTTIPEATVSTTALSEASPVAPVVPDPSPEPEEDPQPAPLVDLAAGDTQTPVPAASPVAPPADTLPVAEPEDQGPLATGVASPEPVTASTPVPGPPPASPVAPEPEPEPAETEAIAPAPGTPTPGTPVALPPVGLTPSPPAATVVARPAGSPVPRVETVPAATPVLPIEPDVTASPVPGVGTPMADDGLVPPAATPIAPMATPVDLEEVPDAVVTAPGAEAITVEAMTRDLEVTPGQPDQYRFQLTNTAGEAVTVRPLAVNSLPGWTGRIVQEDGTAAPEGVLTIGPWQSAIVIVEVTVPTDAHIGELNTISLHLESAEAIATEGEREAAAAESSLEPGDLRHAADGPA